MPFKVLADLPDEAGQGGGEEEGDGGAVAALQLPRPVGGGQAGQAGDQRCSKPQPARPGLHLGLLH